MNCHTMKTKIIIFFALVSVFRLFADCESDKQQLLDWTYDINGPVSNIRDEALTVSRIAGNLSNSTLANSAGRIAEAAQSISTYNNMIRGYAKTIDCTNDTCSVDLGPLVSVCSNIYDVVSSEYSLFTTIKPILESISSSIDEDRLLSGDILAIFREVSNVAPGGYSYVNVFDSRLLSAVSNFNNDVTSSFDTLTNQVASLNSTLSYFYGDWSGVIWDFYQYISEIYSVISVMSNELHNLLSYVKDIYYSIDYYLPYVKTISDDLKLLVTNGTFQADYDFTNQLYSSSLLGFDRFRYYAQGQSNNNLLQLYPLSPYDTASNLRNATIYDALSSGFASLLISQGSINNYLYWLKAIAGSNRLEAVEAHLVAVSNLVGRLDDYVLGDFSNEVSRLVETLSYVTNRVDYTTNLVEITSLLQSSSNHLASIDSKLDVLDYIKVLSNTPLSDFSGDSYYDYLTNLYLNGASSSAPSTNWFERIEILLASMVFGDSASSSISNEVEFTNFSEDTIENAFNDYTFQNELNSGISLVQHTGDNFYNILAGFHNRISGVSVPQSISIGFFDGSDTDSFESLLDHHFSVSFSSGRVDSFTLVVRSVTTIIWVLITMLMVFYSGRWLLSKVLFFYRLMRTLITSLFLK